MFSEQLALILLLAANNGMSAPPASPDPAVRTLQVRMEQNALKKHLVTRLAMHRQRHAAHLAKQQSEDTKVMVASSD